MLILIAIILICSAMSDFEAASDWEASERAAERRHEELMEVTSKKALKKRSSPRQALTITFISYSLITLIWQSFMAERAVL